MLKKWYVFEKKHTSALSCYRVTKHPSLLRDLRHRTFRAKIRKVLGKWNLVTLSGEMKWLLSQKLEKRRDLGCLTKKRRLSLRKRIFAFIEEILWMSQGRGSTREQKNYLATSEKYLGSGD